MITRMAVLIMFLGGLLSISDVLSNGFHMILKLLFDTPYCESVISEKTKKIGMYMLIFGSFVCSISIMLTKF